MPHRHRYILVLIILTALVPAVVAVFFSDLANGIIYIFSHLHLHLKAINK